MAKTPHKSDPIDSGNLAEPDGLKKYMTLEEVADVLNVHYQLVYRLARSGELPTVRLGRVYRVPKADLLAYLESTKKSKSEPLPDMTCAVCGKTYRSKNSLVDSCSECGRPICIDCYNRKNHRYCPDHSKKT